MMTVVGPLLTLALVLAWRLRKPGRERGLSAWFLWFAPAAYLLVILVVAGLHPPSSAGWLLLVAGLLVGGLAGWWRGRLFRLRLDEASGLVLMRRSRWAVTMLVAIVSLRFLANLWLAEGSRGALLLGDAMLGLLLGLVAVTRIQIARRAAALRRPLSASANRSSVA
ncbi:hypothetical protein GCM10022280_20840 [Sphingomonas swuensis]|uniref:DUF1453 domain-containing protein n=1 Tax=Sphingomonas swuensis TaxID=977800 RepID=A0ABP7T3U8_9SPHN